jgi:Holliday junction resolvase RusA-like endonuclease
MSGGLITFTVPGEARAFARAGSHGAQRFTPKPQREFANLVKLKGEEAMAGALPLSRAIDLHVTVRRQVPASASKAKRKAMLEGQIRPTMRPDADNFAKIIGDALNGICWTDDALITDLTVRKIFAEIPGVTVAFMPIGTGDV